MVIYNGKKGFSFPKALVIHGLMYLSIAALFFALGVTLNSGQTEVRTARVYVIPYRVPVVVHDSPTINRVEIDQIFKYYTAAITYRTEQMVNRLVVYLKKTIYLARARQEKVEVALSLGLTP